jgi:hypothetical protein
MSEQKMGDQCLTNHPGFEAGCLNPWVQKLYNFVQKREENRRRVSISLYKMYGVWDGKLQN